MTRHRTITESLQPATTTPGCDMANILAHTDHLLGRLARMTGAPVTACCNIHQRQGWAAAADTGGDVRINGVPLSTLAQRRIADLFVEHDDAAVEAAFAAWSDALDLLDDVAPAHADRLRTAFWACSDALLAAAWRDGWACGKDPGLLVEVQP